MMFDWALCPTSILKELTQINLKLEMKQPQLLTSFLLLVQWKDRGPTLQITSSNLKEEKTKKKNPFIPHLSYSFGQNWKKKQSVW